MSELFREIEEEVKRERLENIWKSFGRFAIWGSVAIIAFTAIYVAWDDYSQRQAEAKTAQLLSGSEHMNTGDYKGAVSIFSNVADDTSSPYYVIAMLQKAIAQYQAGDDEGVKKTYESLAKNDNGSSLGALVKVKAIGDGEAIDAPQSSPFYHTLAEQKAWQLLGRGKNAEAADIFAALANDEKTPISLASRAKEVLRMIAPEKLAAKPAEKKVSNE